MPKIILQKDGSIVNTFDFPERDVITVGSSSGCDVPIEDPALAAEQAKIVLRKDGFYLQLVTHIPAVFVTGERVEGEIKLEDGDTINIEEYDLVLNVLEDEREKIAAAQPKPEPPPEPKPEPEPEVEEKPEKPEEKPPEQKITVDEKPAEPVKPKPESPKPEPEEKPQIIKTEEYRIPDQPEEPPKPSEPEKSPKPVEEIVESEVEEPQKPTIAPQQQEQPLESAEKVAEAPADTHRKTKVLNVSDMPPSPSPVEEPSEVIADEESMWLLCTAGPLKNQKFKLKMGTNKIGRDRKKNDIIVRLDKKGEVDTSISRQHALIDYTDGVYYLSDTKSQMRTKLNNRQISVDEVLPLKEGDKIEICSVKESTVFKIVTEKMLKTPDAKMKIDAVSSDAIKQYLPYIVVAVGILLIVVIIILLVK